MRGNRPIIAVFFLLSILIGQYFFSLPSFAIDVDTLIKDSIRSQFPGLPPEPIKMDRKDQKLEDLIVRQDLPYGYPPMIPLQGISIAGLGQKAIFALGENYFVVRNNTNTMRMADLYRENRAAAKANYVTMDCLVHPYIAFTNRIYAETIKKHLLPLTKTLLLSILKVAVADYRQADDNDVRTDIECNMAFLSLALKLMDSSFAIPVVGRVPQLVQQDYDALVFAKAGHSYIFDRNEDFSFYKPVGWYRSSPELITFYRVKTWMSRLNYPINDVTFEADGIKANNFRRSVLLYRCMELARIDGKPAMDTWMRLVKGMFILGGQVENWQEKNLYAHDYRSVFKTNSADLNVTLSAMAEPLYRTKLLLAVRKQKPISLGSTSIFDIEEARADRESVASFKFMPAIGSPEDPWLRYAAGLYPKPGISTNVFPVALLDLNAWGAPQAANFLLDSSWAMDESMPKTVTELKRWVLRRGVAGQVAPVDCRIWSLLAPSWRLLPDGIQTALRCQMWGNRRLETCFAAWLDSKVCIAPLRYTAPKNNTTFQRSSNDSPSSEDKIGEALSAGLLAEPPLTAAIRRPGEAGGSVSAISKPGQNRTVAPVKLTSSAASRVLNAEPALSSALGVHGTTLPGVLRKSTPATLSTLAGPANKSGSVGSITNSDGSTSAKPMRPLVARRAARGHFLDPVPDFYNRLLIDAQKLEKELISLGFMLEPNLKKELDDYTRLFERFFKIARDEVECKPIAPQDLSLLANIDMILDKIDLPLPAVLPVEPLASLDAKTAPPKDPPQGFTMALGRPGLLYIILMNKNTKEWTLARGAVYTYYEQYGTSLTEESLLNKIDKGTIQVPYWTERFDFVQADKK